MTPFHAWVIYAAIVALPVLALGLIVYSALIVAGRYDDRSEQLFEEYKRHPELKDEDAT